MRPMLTDIPKSERVIRIGLTHAQGGLEPSSTGQPVRHDGQGVEVTNAVEPEQEGQDPPDPHNNHDHSPKPHPELAAAHHEPKVTLYTAVYGRSDWIKPAPKVPDDVQCLFYTDTDEQASAALQQGWQPVIVPHYVATLKGDPRITAPMLAHKWWKTHPELACPTSDVSLWIDGSMEVKVGDYVERCLDALGAADWACVPHPSRDCIYPEAEYSATLTWRYDGPSILAQANFYRQFHPPGWGLIATGANVRRHTPEVIDLCHRWWEENINWSHQDQISLPVLLRLAEGKVPFNYNLPWHEWWTLHQHGGVA
jgi:hypothetical protein